MRLKLVTETVTEIKIQETGTEEIVKRSKINRP